MAAEPDPDRPAERQVIEPTAVFRPAADPGGASGPPVEEWMEELRLFRPPGSPPPSGEYRLADEDTQEMEPRPGAAESWDAAGAPPAAAPAPVGRRPHRAAVLLVAGLGAGIALTLVLLLPRDAATGAAPPTPGGGASAPAAGGTTAPATPSASATASAPVPPSAPATQAPGGGQDQGGQLGVLTLGSTGPRVSDLQTRLLRIPNVYEGGRVNGQYDQTLAEAVSRFQQWYGIRGDANGVYGEATRRDLEART